MLDGSVVGGTSMGVELGLEANRPNNASSTSASAGKRTSAGKRASAGERTSASTSTSAGERASAGEFASANASAQEQLHARFLRRKRQQSAWDAEEARDLRLAESMQLWRRYACLSLADYLEVFGGMDRRTALDRIRVSVALGELPLLEAELEEGTFQFSHVKELTRVVVGETEEDWIRHTRGMTYREVQRAVAGHARGDRPTDPTHADERLRFVGFHVKPSTTARLYALLGDLATERGDAFVDDDDRVNALCDRATSGPAAVSSGVPSGVSSAVSEAASSSGSGAVALAASGVGSGPAVGVAPGEPHVCAPTQVWITSDGHAFAHGVELDDAELATLTCDATIMGHVDDPHARPRHAVSPKQRRRILARDRHQCRVPGCRARHHLDVHHIVHREDGGDHSDANLVTLCSGHHRLHHHGLLDIMGHAPDALMFRRRHGDDTRDAAGGGE